MNHSRPNGSTYSYDWYTGVSHPSNPRPRSPVEKISRDRESVDREKPPLKSSRNFGDYDPVRPRAAQQFQQQTRAWSVRRGQGQSQERISSSPFALQNRQRPSPTPTPASDSQRVMRNPQETNINLTSQFNVNHYRPPPPPQHHQYQYQPQQQHHHHQNQNPSRSDDNNRNLDDLKPGRSELLFCEKAKLKNISVNLKQLPNFERHGTFYYSYMLEFRPFKNDTMKETVDGHESTDKIAARESVFSAALRRLESLMPEEEPSSGQSFPLSQTSRVVLHRRREGEEPTFRIAIPRGPSISSGNRNGTKPPSPYKKYDRNRANSARSANTKRKY